MDQYWFDSVSSSNLFGFMNSIIFVDFCIAMELFREWVDAGTISQSNNGQQLLIVKAVYSFILGLISVNVCRSWCCLSLKCHEETNKTDIDLDMHLDKGTRICEKKLNNDPPTPFFYIDIQIFLSSTANNRTFYCSTCFQALIFFFDLRKQIQFYL